MKECARYARMLGSRPGELGPEEEARLAAHLAECAACRARLADDQATAGWLSEALELAAARRDFTAFADQVMERIPADAWKKEESPRKGLLRSLRAFLGRHRMLAVASALAPVLAAAALYLFLGPPSVTPEPEEPGVEVVSETLSPTVLDTSDGPIVLVSDPDGT